MSASGPVRWTVRPATAADRGAWGELYGQYAAFYAVAQSESQRQVVWSWLQDASCSTSGLLVADGDDVPVGLAHFRPFARPLAASVGCYLDDLYVTEAARGGGATRALLDAVRVRAAHEGWEVVRWITAEDNAVARGLYDRVAHQTSWVTYDMPAV